MTLEDTLADLRERVTMLRVEGHPVQAASVERAIEQLVACLPEYLVLLSEGEAVTYSGRSPYFPSRIRPETCKQDASRMFPVEHGGSRA